MMDCDLEPTTHQPRVRFNFANGWTASVLFRTGGNPCKAPVASLAHWPTGLERTGQTVLGESEASADEVAAFLSEVAAKEPLG